MFSAYVGDEESFRLQLVAGGGVAVVVILVVVIVFVVMFLRSRSNDECNKKQPSDCDTLEYRNGEGTFISNRKKRFYPLYCMNNQIIN